MTATESRIHKAARQYLSRGWCAIPVPPRSKNPNRKEWQNERYEPADVERAFNPKGNVGIHCGKPSNGLCDVDLDVPEAVALAPIFLPATGRRHGRKTNPSSHWWYVCDPVPPGVKIFREPGRKGKKLIELRSTGGQTIVPPSIHDTTGEEYVWDTKGEASEVDGRVLRHDVAKLAACTLLARHWVEGQRHDLALAVAGVLLRQGWSQEYVAEFIEAAARAAGDISQMREHRQAVADTAEALAHNQPATGIPTLAEIMGDATASRFIEWLGIETQQATIILPGEIQPNGKHEPLPQVERQVWGLPKDAPHVDIESLPYWLNRIVRHVKPFTLMFPDEWPVMMALPFWSILWPHIRIQNLNLALWTLGIGRQGGGKNVSTDELQHLIQSITAGEIKLYTAGSPEGLWEALEGAGRQVLAYHDEYAGLLKLFSRDHMSHAKEALCSLYDGRNVGYLRSKGKSVQISDPVLAVVATTTPSALREFGNTSDLTNGYLSRFMMCAPDRINVSPDFSLASEMERTQLAREVSVYRNQLRGVSRVEYAETGRPDPPLINEYRLHLGIDTGEVESLEDALDDRSIPGGRLLARVKKVTALLALAERSPERSSDGQAVLVNDDHIRQAIDITELGYYYAERTLLWIGASQDVQLGDQIHALLRANPQGLSRRELCRRTHHRATEVSEALRLLREEGRVLATKTDNKRSGEIWVAIESAVES